MPRQLTISPATFKSSNLAIPPTPFSPRLPVSPPPSPPTYKPQQTYTSKSNLQLTPPPADPLHWLWQCHLCNRVYQLGVTRRCLDDGHHFCAGTTTVKRSRRNGNKKVVRHKACASEFDYQGWKAWGSWRRSVAKENEAANALTVSIRDNRVKPLFGPTPPTEGQWLNGSWARRSVKQNSTGDQWHKDCWSTCDYPSECRWGKQYGVQTSAKPTVTLPSSPPPAPPPREEEAPKTSFDEILLDLPVLSRATDKAEQIETTSESSAGRSNESEKKPELDDLLESVHRRKRKSANYSPSPLALNPPSPVDSQPPSTTQTLQKAFDDFEFDIRKSFGRAGDRLNDFVYSLKSASALEDDKAEAFVKGLRINRRKTVEDKGPVRGDGSNSE